MATDDELARRALGGGLEAREALGALLQRFAEPLLGFFLLSGFERAAAEDLVQEVALRVIRAREKFDATRPFRPWLWAIARNLARSARRRAAPVPLEDVALHALPDLRPSAREQLEAAQRLERLRAALAQLEPEQREVLVLKHYQGLPCREVAQILGVSEGTVWSRTHRAILALGALLTEGGDLP